MTLREKVARALCRAIWEREEDIPYLNDEFDAGWDNLDADQRERYYIAAEPILALLSTADSEPVGGLGMDKDAEFGKELRVYSQRPTADSEQREAVGSFCPECGFNVRVDEDGCCSACGATATGKAVDALTRPAEQQEVDDLRRKLEDHGPDGHNVTNAQFVNLRLANAALRTALDAIECGTDDPDAAKWAHEALADSPADSLAQEVVRDIQTLHDLCFEPKSLMLASMGTTVESDHAKAHRILDALLAKLGGPK